MEQLIKCNGFIFALFFIILVEVLLLKITNKNKVLFCCFRNLAMSQTSEKFAFSICRSFVGGIIFLQKLF